ncbi:MAG: hypothetical protein ACERKN_20310 [Velocimicrobium sp.]
MEYILAKEAAKNWKITDRMVLYHCADGRYRSRKVKEGVNK